MKLRAILLIVSVLSFTACSKAPEVKLPPPVVQTVKPPLTLPTISPLSLREISWIVLNQNPPLFALSVEDYKDLSLNISDIRTLVKEQNAIIRAYEEYYLQ